MLRNVITQILLGNIIKLIVLKLRCFPSNQRELISLDHNIDRAVHCKSYATKKKIYGGTKILEIAHKKCKLWTAYPWLKRTFTLDFQFQCHLGFNLILSFSFHFWIALLQWNAPEMCNKRNRGNSLLWERKHFAQLSVIYNLYPWNLEWLFCQTWKHFVLFIFQQKFSIENPIENSIIQQFYYTTPNGFLGSENIYYISTSTHWIAFILGLSSTKFTNRLKRTFTLTLD